MNLRAPQIHDAIKLHKQQKQICPIVNWKDSPRYKLAKYITTQLTSILQLSNTYDIQNSISLIHNLKNIEIDENTKLCSFDTENMYQIYQ
jgi:hypothetical protein